jgi:hypothetical protein
MWPEPGSGFEADPFSPAGTAQREWGLIRALGRSRYGRLAVWVFIGLFVCSMVIAFLPAIFARH